ncbi:MAG TPA: hypothetical protein VLH56_17515 [Dissulfurispiraceae bacterium]|nr:hypothetical protein [Dissulfurispiraceae bacterium]
MAPQRHLQEARLEPRGVHFLDVLGGVSLLLEEGLERKRHGKDQQEQIPEGHDFGRGRAVGAVLLRAMVAKANLVVVVKPLLVVLRSGRVEDSLAEALADCAQVVTERLAVAPAGERREQVGVRSDEPVPDIEDRLYLVLQHLMGEAQVLDVLIAKQDALLHQFEVGERCGGARNRGSSIGVSGNVCGVFHRESLFTICC